MAEDFAPLYRTIWSDEDFRALTAGAQRLYLALMSSPSRNSAGVLSLSTRRWARAAADLDVVHVDKQLAELDDADFLVVDYDTDEVLVRAYIRVAKVYRHIRLMARALKDAEAVESDRLRSALGQELVRLPKLVVPTPNGRNDVAVEEANAAQQRLDELASMLCDAPPETAAHPLIHGMGHGMPHPPGVGVGTGVGAVLGSCSSSRNESLESNAGANDLGNVVQGRWAL